MASVYKSTAFGSWFQQSDQIIFDTYLSGYCEEMAAAAAATMVMVVVFVKCSFYIHRTCFGILVGLFSFVWILINQNKRAEGGVHFNKGQILK